MSNLTKAMEPYSAKDVVKIRAIHPILAKFSDVEVELLWVYFSRERCASYLFVDSDTLAEFTEWLES